MEPRWTPDCLSHRVAVTRPGAACGDRPPDEYVPQSRWSDRHLVLGRLLLRRRSEGEGRRISGVESFFGFRDLALRERPAHDDKAAFTALPDAVCHPCDSGPRRLPAPRHQRRVQVRSALLPEPLGWRHTNHSTSASPTIAAVTTFGLSRVATTRSRACTRSGMVRCRASCWVQRAGWTSPTSSHAR